MKAKKNALTELCGKSAKEGHRFESFVVDRRIL